MVPLKKKKSYSYLEACKLLRQIVFGYKNQLERGDKKIATQILGVPYRSAIKIFSLDDKTKYPKLLIELFEKNGYKVEVETRYIITQNKEDGNSDDIVKANSESNPD